MSADIINLVAVTSLEADGRAIAEIESMPGCLRYGSTRDKARRGAVALALSVIADEVRDGTRDMPLTIHVGRMPETT